MNPTVGKLWGSSSSIHEEINISNLITFQMQLHYIKVIIPIHLSNIHPVLSHGAHDSLFVQVELLSPCSYNTSVSLFMPRVRAEKARKSLMDSCFQQLSENSSQKSHILATKALKKHPFLSFWRISKHCSQKRCGHLVMLKNQTISTLQKYWKSPCFPLHWSHRISHQKLITKDRQCCCGAASLYFNAEWLHEWNRERVVVRDDISEPLIIG